MEGEVKFKYGSWEHFQGMNKDNDTLYFLDNSHVYKGDKLLTNVLTVWPEDLENGIRPAYTVGSIDQYGFPDKPLPPQLRECYIISLKNGEIRYVNSELDYVSITDLVLFNNILVNQNFLQQLIAAIADTQTIDMPTLTVQGKKLVWTGSNVDSMTVFVPKQ